MPSGVCGCQNLCALVGLITTGAFFMTYIKSNRNFPPNTLYQVATKAIESIPEAILYQLSRAVIFCSGGQDG